MCNSNTLIGKQLILTGQALTSDLLQSMMQLLEAHTFHAQCLQFLPQMAVPGQLLTEASQGLSGEETQSHYVSQTRKDWDKETDSILYSTVYCMMYCI